MRPEDLLFSSSEPVQGKSILWNGRVGKRHVFFGIFEGCEKQTQRFRRRRGYGSPARMSFNLLIRIDDSYRPALLA